MPNPKDYDTKEAFMEQCVPQVLADGTAENQDQAVAVCTNMWNEQNSGEKSAGKHIERRYLNQKRANVRQDDNDENKVTGYAAVYYNGNDDTEFLLFREDNIDIVERISPGAFDAVLNTDVRSFYNHDMNRVLGRTKSGTLRIGSDARGLWYEIELPDTQTASEVKELIKRGDVDGSSFSFGIDDIEGAVEWTAEEGKEVRWLKRFDELIDVGPVAMPAYEGTVADARSKEHVSKERRDYLHNEKDESDEENRSQGKADLAYIEATLATRRGSPSDSRAKSAN